MGKDVQSSIKYFGSSCAVAKFMQGHRNLQKGCTRMDTALHACARVKGACLTRSSSAQIPSSSNKLSNPTGNASAINIF